MTQPTTRRTWRCAAATLTFVLGMGVLSACGGGSSAAPKSISLSGDKIPVSTLETGLAGMCTVAHQANNVAAASATYFAGPYNNLHQLAATLQGSRRTEMLADMTAFEQAVLNPSASSSASSVTAANKLLGTVDADLKSMKLPPANCKA